MSERILSSLTACGLLDLYKHKFDENEVDDAVLIENEEVDKYLPMIIPTLGHRLKFMTQFKKFQMSSASDPQQQEEQQEKEEDHNSTISNMLNASSTKLENDVGSLLSFGGHENEKPLRLTSKEALELATKFYNEAMNNLMIGDGKFYEEPILREAHEDTRAKSIELFQISYDNFNSQSSQGKTESQEGVNYTTILTKDLNNKIDKDFKMILLGNELNQTKYNSKAHHSLENAEKLYKNKMKKLMENANTNNIDKEELITKEIEVNEQVLKHFNENIQNPSASKEFIDELNEKFKSFSTDWFGRKMEKFTKKSTEDEFVVKEALFAIKNYYNEEMDKNFKGSDFIEPSTLIKLHETISTAAVKSCRQYDLTLTHNQKTQLQEALKVIYKKYEDKNLMRKQASSSPAIGIDLGTTYSCVAVYRNGKAEVIHNQNGNKTTASYVAFETDGSIVVGDPAKDQSHTNPRNTIFDAKRLIGRKFSEVKGNLKSWPFIVLDHDGKPRIKIQAQPNILSEKAHTRAAKKRKFGNDYDCYHPEEISAMVLKKMKDIAEDYLGCEVKNAVITVPALFNDSQRQATRDAGEIAGLNVLRIINEPTAAAIAYNLHRQDDLKRNVLVFDLGGGTFDVAVLEITKGEIEVKAVHGDPNLGGQNFDEEMINHCIESFKTEHGIKLSKGKDSSQEDKKYQVASCLRRIRSQCEEKKKALSYTSQVAVAVPNISGRLDLHVPFTRDLFESMNKKYFDKCLEIVQKALDEAGKDKSEINDIVLIGGSTRIPKLQEMLSDFFDGKSLSKTVNPDETVAVGAAIQACISNGGQVLELEQVKIKDVTPHSIGISNAYGNFEIEIPKNTPIPCSVVSEYHTLDISQSAVRVEVFEGENEVARNNHLLGSFRLTGLPFKIRDKEPIKVKLQINEEGILSVQALCEKNNVRNEIVIPLYKNRLDREEIREAAL